jgi:hypothetical protein
MSILNYRVLWTRIIWDMQHREKPLVGFLKISGLGKEVSRSRLQGLNCFPERLHLSNDRWIGRFTKVE